MQVLIVIAFVSMAMYILAVLFLWRMLPLKRVQSASDVIPHISVVVPFRDEAERIVQCVKAILANRAPGMQFELIMVNDHSEDASVSLLQSMVLAGEIKVLHSAGTGKKEALLCGIQAAGGNIILCTDADSFPTNTWVQTMATAFAKGNLNMLCGPVALTHSKGLFGKLQQAESSVVVGISAAMMHAKLPATCNGANLMFRKDLFFFLGAYGPEAEAASGDDDLLMQRFFRHNTESVRYCLDPAAMVYAPVCSSWQEFIQQRLRWISKRRHYVYPYNAFLQILVVSQMMAFMVLSGLWLFHGNVFAGWVLLIKFAAELVFALRLRNCFRFKLYTIWLLPFYQLYVWPLLVQSLYRKPVWKGRNI